jgi:hypothetical protein
LFQIAERYFEIICNFRRRPNLQPRIPWWLTIDLTVIVMSVILIGIGFWIGVL